MLKPKLFLVGAGPGDPELITIKAVRIIAEAPVILYDALVNEEILKYASSNAVKRFVGKKYGCNSISQEKINTLIVKYAYSHGHVARLKGGDPFVFGRAMEEIEAARNADIDIEVVPGISSAIAVPASKMIPLTCRGVNESFWVTTGTTQSGQISKDIKLAAQSNATVIILMAMSKLHEIMDIFKTFNKEDTPVAVIQNGTTKNEKMVIGNVKDICLKSHLAQLENPSIIVVGEVVKFQMTSFAEMSSLVSDNALR